MFLFVSCKEKDNRHYIKDSTIIPMPNFYRKATGMDSIQLIFGGRAKYNESKKGYDVTWDSLYANFCNPNKWEFEKWKKNEWEYDSVHKIIKIYSTVHDTIYIGDAGIK